MWILGLQAVLHNNQSPHDDAIMDGTPLLCAQSGVVQTKGALKYTNTPE